MKARLRFVSAQTNRAICSEKSAHDLPKTNAHHTGIVTWKIFSPQRTINCGAQLNLQLRLFFSFVSLFRSGHSAVCRMCCIGRLKQGQKIGRAHWAGCWASLSRWVTAVLGGACGLSGSTQSSMAGMSASQVQCRGHRSCAFKFAAVPGPHAVVVEGDAMETGALAGV